MKSRFIVLLLLAFGLIACRQVPETESLPSPTAAETTAAVVPTETAVSAPTPNPTPAATATESSAVQPAPEPTAAPAAEVDPFALARQLIEQVGFAAPTGWKVESCEGEAAVLCISDGQENVGFAELLVFPLAGYVADHPVRMAAAALPADASTYSAEQTAVARQALATLAQEHLDIIAADRAITYPNDDFTALPAELAQMGNLPALTFGFIHSNQAGATLERYVNVAAFDQHFIYWFSINYDPANISTFVSDTAVTQFTPFLLQIAASLPLHLAPVSQVSLNTGGLARLLPNAPASLAEGDYAAVASTSNF